MSKIKKTTTVELTVTDIEHALRSFYRLPDGAKIRFDIGSDPSDHIESRFNHQILTGAVATYEEPVTPASYVNIR